MSTPAARIDPDDPETTRRMTSGARGFEKIRGHLGGAFYNILVGRIPSHTLRLEYLRLAGAAIGRHSTILLGTMVAAPTRIRIGDHTLIGYQCFLGGESGLVIGDNVNVSSYTLFIGGGHDYNHPGFLPEYRASVIEDYVWIGTRCTVLGGLRIGRGAVVGAASLVNRDVAPYTVVAGVPARKIGERDPAACTYELNYRPLFF